MDWEFRVSKFKLLYREQTNKGLLFSTGNYIQYLGINCNGKEQHKKNAHMCITESSCCMAEINTNDIANQWYFQRRKEWAAFLFLLFSVEFFFKGMIQSHRLIQVILLVFIWSNCYFTQEEGSEYKWFMRPAASQRRNRDLILCLTPLLPWFITCLW